MKVIMPFQTKTQFRSERLTSTFRIKCLGSLSENNGRVILRADLALTILRTGMGSIIYTGV